MLGSVLDATAFSGWMAAASDAAAATTTAAAVLWTATTAARAAAPSDTAVRTSASAGRMGRRVRPAHAGRTTAGSGRSAHVTGDATAPPEPGAIAIRLAGQVAVGAGPGAVAHDDDPHGRPFARIPVTTVVLAVLTAHSLLSVPGGLAVRYRAALCASVQVPMLTIVRLVVRGATCVVEERERDRVGRGPPRRFECCVSLPSAHRSIATGTL
jgi:hypothetical protein